MNQKNSDDLLNLMKKYMKIDYFEMKTEKYERKEYLKSMTLENSRVMFGLRSKMTRTIKTHYSHEKAFNNELWNCMGCNSKIDSIFHVKNCLFYHNFRQKYPNLEADDDQLVEYFKEIIKMRENQTQTEQITDETQQS